MRSTYLAYVVAIVTWLLAGSAWAASSVDVVPADLNALISEAAGNPSQFAVNVPHAVDLQSAGTWSASGATQMWTYSVQVRGAVSLSFHAPRMNLPPSAILTVRSASTTTTYRTVDVGRGDFWSRVQPGDTLEFRLEVTAAERALLLMQIASFQAGFRGLSPEVPNHPQISRVRALAAGDPDTPCVQNYACSVTPANSPSAQATVALLVSNQYQCTGTLINNVARDNTPYILTARHCQNGKYGGGSPGAASTVSVYWNAQSSCGATLRTVFYTPQSARQTGATTVVEQQDAWLIQLDTSPVVADAQYAGFDASGSAISGGYSIHHALSYNRQLTRWYGTAFPSSATGVQGTSFVSDLLDTVNEFGVTGPGASGAALFSASNRLVGVLSLGRRQTSTSGYGSCPASTPANPGAGNSEASFVSLAGIWNSTADSTSSTGARTLRSVLDPGNSGSTSVGSMQAARLAMDASAFVAAWNTTVTLSWTAANATQCTATGGSGADGWSGVLAGNGSTTVTQSSGGDTAYRLRCDLAGGGSVAASLVIHWNPPQAQPLFVGQEFSRWTTRPLILAWQAVIGPCALSGGALSLSGLPASGSVTTTSSTPGDVTYLLTCGVPGSTQTTQHTVSYVTPSLTFVASGGIRKLGQSLSLGWSSLADSCTPTGGMPGDQWTRSTRIGTGSYQAITRTTGTFIFGLNCVSGDISLQRSVQVTVDDQAPFVTLTPVQTPLTLSYTPSDYIRLRYSTNLSTCSQTSQAFRTRLYVPPIPSGPPLPSFFLSDGEWVFAPEGPGTFSVTITCLAEPGTPSASATASATVTVLPPPPPTATITSSVSSVAAGTPFTITWSSTNALNCAASGAVVTEGANYWTGQIGGSGSHVVQPQSVSWLDARYTITCPSIDPGQPAATASVLVTVGTPGVSLQGSNISAEIGTSFTLSWNEPNASSCSASGGGANGSPWTGALTTAGSVTQTASVSGTHTYTLTCIVNGTTRQSSLPVIVAAASGGGAGGGGTSGGGSSGASNSGGGGASDGWALLALLALGLRRLTSRGSGTSTVSWAAEQ